jgi:hypothetical protein
MGFSVDSNGLGASDIRTQTANYTALVDYFVRVQTGQLSPEGLPVKWLGSLILIEREISKCVSAEGDVDEPALNVSSPVFSKTIILRFHADRVRIN